jgi:hypothetical protein
VFVAPEQWGAVGGYPLGRWLADVRRYYAAGSLEGKRVTELEALGMVWSAWNTAWADGLAVAKDYVAVHGHFLPPTNAVWGGGRMAIGVWAKNQRAAARKTHESAVRRAAGESGVSSAGELGGRGARAGPGSRSLDDGAAGRLGQVDARAAVDARQGPGT